MKNVFKLKAIQRIAGIIAFVAVIGFNAVSCKDAEDDTSEKYITVTGIPGTIISGEIALGLYNSNKEDFRILPFAGGVDTIAGGSVTVELVDNNKGGSWTGTGDYYVFFSAWPPGISSNYYLTKTKHKISKANTTIAFSEFDRF
jgi:hypothetical protein